MKEDTQLLIEAYEETRSDIYALIDMIIDLNIEIEDAESDEIRAEYEDERSVYKYLLETHRNELDMITAMIFSMEAESALIN